APRSPPGHDKDERGRHETEAQQSRHGRDDPSPLHSMPEPRDRNAHGQHRDAVAHLARVGYPARRLLEIELRDDSAPEDVTEGGPRERNPFRREPYSVALRCS